MQEQVKEQKVRVKLYWNRFKAEGKTWIAKLVNGRIVEFMNTVDFEADKHAGKARGYVADSGDRIYELGDGEYMLRRPNTQSYGIRQIIKVTQGQIEIIKTLGEGYSEGLRELTSHKDAIFEV